MVETLNTFLALGTIFLQIASVALFILALVQRNNPFLGFVSRHAEKIAFLLAFGSLVASLIYSDGIGYAPCTMCWYQRIFIYPQAFLFAIAVIKKEYIHVWQYANTLSVIGILFSINHLYIESGGNSLIPCSASVSCSARYVYEFGYISIPMMAATFFVSILVLGFIKKRTTSL